jgi:NAD(P)-dependent dehydrogenase (short-subunit alcohol dehydrogenase family)
VFKDKVALITGGGSGIGCAVGQELGRRGAKVILADIDRERAAVVAAGIKDKGGWAEAVQLDVADAAQVESAVARVFESHGRLDYLFNNAGIGGTFAEVHEIGLEDWQRVLAINLHGVVHGVVAAYPRMVKQGFGHIVNTASAAGLVPNAMLTVYSTTKHAVVGLSGGLRIEARAHGVKVSAVCPGFVQTAIFERGTTYKRGNWETMRRLLPKPIDADACARAIVRGVAKNRPLIVITWSAWALWLLYRLSARLTFFVMDLAIRRGRAVLGQVDATSGSR